MTLVKCISWLMLIPSILLTWIALAPARHRGRLRLERGQKKFSKPKLIFVGIASILIAVIGGWVLPNDPAFGVGCTTNSRIGLAILSYLMLIIPSVMAYFLVVVLYMNSQFKPS